MIFEKTTELLTLNTEPFPQQKLSTMKTTTTETKQASKLILKSALQKANIAVQCDASNDVNGAIDAYKEAISLLECVLSSVEKENDRKRLQSIHDSYSERIRLLSIITLKLDMDILNKQKDLSKESIFKKKTSSHIPVTLNYWQDNTDWSSKENYSVSPPVFQLQASKSTPTHPHYHNPLNSDEDDDEEEEEEEEECYDLKLANLKMERNAYNILTQRSSNTFSINNAHSSHRSSISSVDSIVSSVNSMADQPSMSLPSLKKSEQKEESKSTKETTVFKTSNNKTIPRSSSMSNKTLPRSSSMSTVDSLSQDELIHHILSEQAEEHNSYSSSQPYTPQMIINRPNRPTAGGIGSMRRKAVHRLSMDSFTIGRSKERISSSPSTGNINYNGFSLRDQIMPLNNSDQQVNLKIDTKVTSEEPVNTHFFKLLFAIEKSMIEGAHITPKLYIPKNLWQQTNIRLSSMDIKTTSCEQLIRDINKLDNWMSLDDLKNATKILSHFEISVNQLQKNLAKKLKRDLDNPQPSLPAQTVVVDKKAPSFISWGTITKSVEKINAFSLTKTEDQYKIYIETLQKCLSKIHTLERWIVFHQSAQRKSKQSEVLVTKLVKISSTINDVLGGFILNDVTVLLSKWIKRGGSWVNE